METNYFDITRAIVESADGGHMPDLRGFSPRQLMQFLRFAKSNRVLFVLCRNIRQNGYLGIDKSGVSLVDKVVAEGDKINKEYATLLREVKNKFTDNGIDFLIVKTDRSIDYILSDVDILVREEHFQEAERLLASFAVYKDVEEEEGRWHYKFAHRVQMDLHKTGFDWYSDNFIDAASIWDNVEKREFLGGVYNFPSAQNEWIFNALNIIYEKFSLTYLDFVFFTKNKSINFWQINEIARRHSWAGGLRILNTYLNKLEEEIKSGRNVSLPIMFSNIDFLKIFIPRLFSPLRNYRTSFFYFCYFIYCKARFVLTRKSRIPFYGSWFNEI